MKRTHHGGEGAGFEGVTSTRRAGQTPGGWGDRQQLRAVTKVRPPMAPLPQGMPSPTPVTPEEKGREMAKCLLGLKLLNYIK